MDRPSRVARRPAARLAAALVVATSFLTGCDDSLPPLGEALLIVDTDLPVPRLAARLRVDLYTLDGLEWYESRDIALLDRRDWPVSFSLYVPDEDESRSALVRLRVYPQGKVRDYRGERFAPISVGGDPAALWVVPDPPEGETPRLWRDGGDITPATEPQPTLAIDRLLVLHLEPGEVGSYEVVMRGTCSGTQADWAGRTTCVAVEASRRPAPTADLDPDMDVPTTSRQGNFGGEVPCSAPTRPAGTAGDGTPLFDEEVCVSGGAFVFGNADSLMPAQQTTEPERLALLPPFRFDRYEVSVARWRDGVARGFVSPDQSPAVNDGGFPAETTDVDDLRWCTFSTTLQGRETYPVTCVSWAAARAFCQFEGGDLPTEAQWEYVAQATGRPAKTRYPWGNYAPTCEQAIYARNGTAAAQNNNADWCYAPGNAGPAPVDARAHPEGDVVASLGVAHLAGNVTEIVMDTHVPFNAQCVIGASIQSPLCLLEGAHHPLFRGGDWSSSAEGTYLANRNGSTSAGPLASIKPYSGFRCARPGDAR
ncbi:MAG: SUMF1/EgtB/PvdO family nonheme iron enzyme [Deltaproteobacteria bacterium]|nr:SUMF1/EgtB/PvdO family nonheme iron enzyme [Deltaproteobacteria bacterium]